MEAELKERVDEINNRIKSIENYISEEVSKLEKELKTECILTIQENKLIIVATVNLNNLVDNS